MKIASIIKVVLVTITWVALSQCDEDKIDFYISRDQNQKHIYTFDDNVIKAQIIKDKNDQNKNKESICEIKKQKMKLKTLFNGILANDQMDNSSTSAEFSEFLLLSKYQDYFVAVRKSGDIQFFQIKDNNLSLISSTQAYPKQLTEEQQTLIQVFLQDDFLYLLSADKDQNYYLKVFLIANVEKIKSATDQPQKINGKKSNGKLMCVKLRGEYLYMLYKFFSLTIVQIDEGYKKPKSLKQIYISNLFQPHSFDLDSEKLYMIDEEKGIFEFKMQDIHQSNTKQSDFYLKGDCIYNKSKSGFNLLKPFQGENYFIVTGKQNNRNYIAEIFNDSLISTNDDEPIISKIYVNSSYIIFLTEDNIHILYRGIDEAVVKPTEKQYTFELIGVQDIFLDKTNDNLFFAITSNRIISLSVQRTQSSISCFYNERAEVSEERQNKYVVSYITNKCNDESIRYCSHEIEMNAYIGKPTYNSDSEAFLIGLCFGIGIIGIIMIIVFIKKNKVAKIEKYNSFHNEQDQELEQAQQMSSNKV